MVRWMPEREPFSGRMHFAREAVGTRQGENLCDVAMCYHMRLHTTCPHLGGSHLGHKWAALFPSPVCREPPRVGPVEWDLGPMPP